MSPQKVDKCKGWSDVKAMPITETPYPVLSQFVCSVVKVTGAPPQPVDTMSEEAAQAEKKEEDTTTQKLPKGVVLGKDGKP